MTDSSLMNGMNALRNAKAEAERLNQGRTGTCVYCAISSAIQDQVLWKTNRDVELDADHIWTALLQVPGTGKGINPMELDNADITVKSKREDLNAEIGGDLYSINFRVVECTLVYREYAMKNHSLLGNDERETEHCRSTAVIMYNVADVHSERKGIHCVYLLGVDPDQAMWVTQNSYGDFKNPHPNISIRHVPYAIFDVIVRKIIKLGYGWEENKLVGEYADPDYMIDRGLSYDQWNNGIAGMTAGDIIEFRKSPDCVEDAVMISSWETGGAQSHVPGRDLRDDEALNDQISVKQVEEEQVLEKKEIQFDFAEIEKRDALQTLKGHTNVICALCFDATERFLFSGSGDKAIIMWNIKTNERVKTLHGHTDWTNCVAATRSGFLLSGSDDKSVKKWNIESGKCVQTMKVDAGCYSISMTSDERTVAIGISDNSIPTTLLADTDTLKVNHKINGWDAKFAKDDNVIIAATNKRKDITIYQVADATAMKTIKYGSEIFRLAVTKDASIVVTGAYREIIFWDVSNGVRMHTLANAHFKWVSGLNFTSNERYILSCSIDKTINTWRVEDGQRVAKLKGGDNFFSAVLSKKDTRYFTGSTSNTIKVWYLRDEEE